MCVDPVSLTAMATALSSTIGSAATAIGGASGLSTAFTVGSGLLGAYASYTSGQAANKAANLTAAEEERAAYERIQQGDEESDRRRRAGAIQAGEQRAALAANGIDVGDDLAIDILDDSSTLVNEDAFAIRENARRGAQGLSNQARNTRQQGANAASDGLFGAVGTILTTGAKVGDKFKHWSNTGSTDKWAGLRTSGAY